MNISQSTDVSINASVASNINTLAIKNVELANAIVKNNGNQVVANNLVKNANKLMNLADNVTSANLSANVVLEKAVNVSANTKLTANTVANNILKATENAVTNLKPNNGITNVIKAINKVANNVPVQADPNATAMKVANAAVKAANVISENSAKIANKIGVAPYNAAFSSFAKAKKANNTMIIATNGTVKKFNATKFVSNLNKKTKKQAFVNAPTNKQHYNKTGVVKQVHKNNKGSYVKSSGMNGNVKNYLYTGMMV